MAKEKSRKFGFKTLLLVKFSVKTAPLIFTRFNFEPFGMLATSEEKMAKLSKSTLIRSQIRVFAEMVC